MSISDTSKTHTDSTIDTAPVFDAIVVGSGISGGYAAKELCEQGLATLMIERGREVEHRKDYKTEGVPPWQFDHRGRATREHTQEQYVQSKVYAYSDATKQFFINDKENPYSTAAGTQFDWFRGDQLGGKSLLWHRQSYRMSDLDFTANALDGHGSDWPIRYSDIAPWYSKVEEFVGISGSYENIEHLPDSVFLPPFEMNAVEAHLRDKFADLYPDRPMIVARAAHLTEPQEHHKKLGRYQCQSRDECQKGCSFGAYFSTQSATLPAAQATGNLTVRTDAVVQEVLFDADKGRASGVRIFDRRTGKTDIYRANIIFLCASTLATTQIMLNSKSDAFPEGIANSSGVLGHYLMDHVQNCSAHGYMSGFDDDYYVGRRPATTFIPRFRNLESQQQDYLRGFSFMAFAKRENYANLKDKVTGIGGDLKAKLRQPGRWKMSLFGMGEMLPRYDNKVSLHPTRRDRYGLPELVIDCSFGDNDRKMMQDIASTGEEMLKAAGCDDVVGIIGDSPPGTAIHEVGTARMGTDPKSSVLNGNHQTHDIPNLFVTDGASWASCGWVNPSLTFMAMTARAANFAGKLYRKQGYI